MVSFELSKEIKKDVFVLSRAWDKEKILSPCEEWNLRPLDSTLRCSITEPQRLNSEQGLLWSAKSKGLRFNSSWGLRIFSLSHALTR